MIKNQVHIIIILREAKIISFIGCGMDLLVTGLLMIPQEMLTTEE